MEALEEATEKVTSAIAPRPEMLVSELNETVRKLEVVVQEPRVTKAVQPPCDDPLVTASTAELVLGPSCRRRKSKLYSVSRNVRVKVMTLPAGADIVLGVHTQLLP